MSKSIGRASLFTLVGLTFWGVTTSQAIGQFYPRAGSVTVMQGVPSVANQAINPNFRIAPNLTVPQAAFNTVMAGQALGQIPAYAFGFNPYPQFANFGPSFPQTGLNSLGLGVGGSSLTTSPYGLGGLGSAGLSSGGYGGGSLSSSGYGSGSSPYSSGYGGGYYYEDPYAGYLRGVASVTSANGNFFNQVQQARLLQTQADSSKLDLRRRIREEAALERRNWLNPEAERVKDMQNAYVRATHEAPITEVLSAQSLNDLYNHIYPLQEKLKSQVGATGPTVPLDPEVLRQINLTGAGSLGSVALLKDRGRLSWPLPLQAPEFDAKRKEINTLAAEAVNQVRLNNPVDAAMLRDMLGDIRQLSETLLREVGEMRPSEYVEAKRFLSGLEGAIRALQDPGAVNQLNQNWTPQARNVFELVDFMGQRGLKFAPATAGDEPAYRHLYQRLVAYDAALGDTLAKR